MSQNEQNLEFELKLKEASIKELQLKLELAEIELETKKLDPEILKMLHEENSRVREHEARMAKLKTEEMNAQSEIEKQRFEERQQVMKEVEGKFDEIKQQISAIQIDLQQAKVNGGMDLKKIAGAISTVTMLICSYFGIYGTAAAKEVVASLAGVTPIAMEVIKG